MNVLYSKMFRLSKMDRKDITTWPQEYKDEYASDPKYSQMTPEVANNTIRAKLSLAKVTTKPRAKVEIL